MPSAPEIPAKATSAPRGRRPRFPKDYGVPTTGKGLLPWSHVEERMAAAKHYWISTVGADGAPHARPVDGMWIDGRLFFGGSPEARWMKNAKANPLVCVHLESGDDVVILHGEVETTVPGAAVIVRLVEAAKEKYGYSAPPEAYGKGVSALRVRKVYAWTHLPRDATRWDPGSEAGQ